MRGYLLVVLATGSVACKASTLSESRRVLEDHRVVMVNIHGGTHHHLRGSTAIQPFLLDLTPISSREYARCVDDGVCNPAQSDAQSKYCNLQYGEERAAHPINCLTYDQAVTFCGWRRARLPTADEWRWVAENRGLRTKYPWGRRAHPSPICKIRDEKSYATCPVGSGHATRDGVLDMGENVAEWVSVGKQEGAVMGTPPDERALSERKRDLSRTRFLSDVKGIGIGARCARDLP